MDLAEFYVAVGGDLNAIKARLVTEERIIKFLKMFPQDTSFSELTNSMSKDVQTAFRMAHTLKGLALNLGLENLAKTSMELTENLRDLSFKSDSEALYEAVKKDYETVISSLTQLQ